MNITAIGEILFDIYPSGKNLGGAPFNFMYHIMKLTGNGTFISAVGNDDMGKEIINFFNKNNLNDEFIQTDKMHPTGAAHANLDKNKVPHWEIEKDTAYDHITRTAPLKNLVFEKTDCLYFGTLACREETSRSTIHSLFNSKKIKYFCDLNIRQNFYTKEIIEKSLLTSDVLKLNVDELKLVNDLLLKLKYDLTDLSKIISEKYKIKIICVTMGEEGSFLFRGSEANHTKQKIKNVIDTVGAGDAFAAVLCLGFLYEWDISKINHLASKFAAEIVKIEGALPKDESIYEKFKLEINQ